MSKHASFTPAPVAKTAARDVEKAFQAFMSVATDTIARLDPAKEETLQFVVGTLIRAHVEQKDMADALAVSRTTIGRWANGQNLPRSESYRTWAVEGLRRLLATRVASPSSR
jgi:DNA-binding transcriptional regulator YiaG